METFDALMGPVTLVQEVIPLGTEATIQEPEEIGAEALVGPVTVAVNKIVLASVAVDAFAVTENVGVTGSTVVVGEASPDEGE